MMPPMSGIDASAAATLEGSPVDVGAPGLGGGGETDGSAGSAMAYIHKLVCEFVKLTLAPGRCNFRFHESRKLNTVRARSCPKLTVNPSP